MRPRPPPAEIVALVKDGARVETLNEGERGIVIVNQTPFYGESGGQIGDRGWLIAGQEHRVQRRGHAEEAAWPVPA